MNNQTTIIVKNLTVTLSLLLAVQFSFAQLRVTKTGGHVGIGLTNPTQKLDVNGNALIRGGLLRVGTNQENGSSVIDLGNQRTIDGTSAINLYSKTGDKFKARFFTKTTDEGIYETSLMHYGDGDFAMRAWDSNASIKFITMKSNNKPSVSLVVKPEGEIGIGIKNPEAKLHVNGDAKKNGGGEWATTSDKRTKKNIDEYTRGLNAVLQLNPVTFNYNGKAGITDTEKTHVGLIAQELAEIEPDAVQTFTYIEEGSNKTEEFLSLDASSIKYMLVNAIKELQALIELQQSNLEKQQTLAQTQQAEIENLKIQIADLAKGSISTFPTDNEMNVLLEGNGTETGLLSQNSPNPFTTQTRIEYFIPSDSRHCRMSFRDMNGKEIKQVNIEHDGVGAIELSAKDLASGIYSYVLYVNGDIVASKKMILK